MGNCEKPVIERGKRYTLRKDDLTQEVVAVWPAGDDPAGINTWWVRDARGSEYRVQIDKLSPI